MAATKPPVIGTAVTAWQDAFRVIGAMPLVVGIAFAILFAVSLVSVWIIPDPYAFATSGWEPVFAIISSIVQALLLAPLAIVVHRYVLLGELTNRYPLDPSSARYARFVGFAILVKLLLVIPSTFETMLPNLQENPVLEGALGILAVVLLVIIIIVIVRRAILFPAIAIDAPGATWSNARRDTKGSSWRVALIFLCTAVPPAIIGLVLWYLLLRQGIKSSGSWLAFSLLGVVVEIPTLCAFAAAASHIFRARAESLALPAG